VTPVLTQDGRYLPEVTISKKDCRARPSTYSPVVFTKDGRRAWPSLPTLPGTDGTIGRQGPGVRTGRLGTLNELRTAHPRSPLRLTFRNELHVVMMRIMPRAEHERVGVGLYTEILVRSPSIPSRSYKPLMGLGAAPSGVSDVNDKEGGSCLRLRTRVGSPGNLGLP